MGLVIFLGTNSNFWNFYRFVQHLRIVPTSASFLPKSHRSFERWCSRDVPAQAGWLQEKSWELVASSVDYFRFYFLKFQLMFESMQLKKHCESKKKCRHLASRPSQIFPKTKLQIWNSDATLASLSIPHAYPPFRTVNSRLGCVAPHQFA